MKSKILKLGAISMISGLGLSAPLSASAQETTTENISIVEESSTEIPEEVTDTSEKVIENKPTLDDDSTGFIESVVLGEKSETTVTTEQLSTEAPKVEVRENSDKSIPETGAGTALIGLVASVAGAIALKKSKK